MYVVQVFKKSIPVLPFYSHAIDVMHRGTSGAGSVTVGGRLSASHVTGKGFTNGMTPTQVIRVSVVMVMDSLGETQMS